MASWGDWIPPSDVEPGLVPFFGADPCWTPAREEKLADSPDRSPGACYNCGGDRGFPLLDADGLPVFSADGSQIVVSEIPPGSRRICMRCLRSGSDQHSMGARPDGIEVMPVAEPGYVSRGGVSVPERYSRLLNGS